MMLRTLAHSSTRTTSRHITSTAAAASSASSSATTIAIAATASCQHNIASRSFHTSGALYTKPKKSAWSKYAPQPYKPAPGLERVVHQYTSPNVNYNSALFSTPEQCAKSNAEVTMKLLQQQMKKVGTQTKSNVMVSPITLARALTQSKSLSSLGLSSTGLQSTETTDYARLIETLTASGDVTLNVSAANDGTEAGKVFAASLAEHAAQGDALRTTQLSHLVKLPFPLNSTTTPEPITPYTIHNSNNNGTSTSSKSSSSTSSSSSTGPLTHALGFTGYLAPKFASPDTKYPNYFYNFLGEKTIAHMMVKTAKMWYIEHELFQMVDLPYLNDNFVATLVLPRVGADRTIQDHPDEFAYSASPRRASTIHEVLQYFTTLPASSSASTSGISPFTHHLRHMTRMEGLIGLPGFTSDYQMSERDATGGKVQSDSIHRSVVSISPHGLDVGAKTPRTRGGHIIPNFIALFDRPFLFFLRSTKQEVGEGQILFAGVVNDVFERKDFKTKYPLPEEWTNFKDEVGKQIKEMYSKAQ